MLLFALALPAAAPMRTTMAAAASIIEVTTPTELAGSFCAADVGSEHILVLPAALFVDSQELICPTGP